MSGVPEPADVEAQLQVWVSSVSLAGFTSLTWCVLVYPASLSATATTESLSMLSSAWLAFVAPTRYKYRDRVATCYTTIYYTSCRNFVGKLGLGHFHTLSLLTIAAMVSGILASGTILSLRLIKEHLCGWKNVTGTLFWAEASFMYSQGAEAGRRPAQTDPPGLEGDPRRHGSD